MTHAAKEGIWLQQLIQELYDVVITPTILYCDNQAALTLATTDNFHAWTKHIDICYHFIRHQVETGAFKLIYCPTNDMVADILTKALPSPCLVMAYVIHTPSRRLESYIIHTPADVGQHLDSYLFHTSADAQLG